MNGSSAATPVIALSESGGLSPSSTTSSSRPSIGAWIGISSCDATAPSRAARRRKVAPMVNGVTSLPVSRASVTRAIRNTLLSDTMSRSATKGRCAPGSRIL